MSKKCPLCGQTLPAGLSQRQLELKMKRLASPFLEQEKRQLKKELSDQHREQLRKQQEIARRKALSQARSETRKRLDQLKKKEAEARRELFQKDRQHKAQVKQIEVATQAKAEKRLKQKYEAQMGKVDEKRNRESKRHEEEKRGLRQKVEQLSRKLEKVTSEQRGEEGERDLFRELGKEFRGDKIERVGKGIKGADVIQHVMVGRKEVGRIVYESKNTANWQNAFITKAKSYKKKYDTPYVLVVSKALPRGQKGLCVRDAIPVVEPAMAVHLSRIIRDAILEISEFRVPQEGRRAKQERLYDYIISRQFRTRFTQVAETIKELRDQQDEEKESHEEIWDTRKDMLDRIDTCRREVSSKMKSITTEPATKRKLKVVRKTA